MRERKDIRNKRKQRWSTFLNEINYQPLINRCNEKNDTERQQKITLTPFQSYISPNKTRSYETEVVDHSNSQFNSTKPFETTTHRYIPIDSSTSPIFAPSVLPFNNSSPSGSPRKPHLTTGKPQPSEPLNVESEGTINPGNFIPLLF
jgi:hypothetical protein